MKKRTVQALILSATMVYLGVSVVPVKGQDNIIETDVAAQAETTEIKYNLTSGITNTIYGLLENLDNAEFNDKINETIIAMNNEIQSIEEIEDKKEYFVTYKRIVEKYSYILDPPETIYDYFTKEELDMFFHVVQAEIGDEYSFNQKCNVASVILNRINHHRFSNKMFEILIANQFETISNGRYKEVEVSEDTILACEYVFMFGDTTGGALFFDSNNKLKYKFLFNDDAHNFYTLKEE